MRSRWKKLGILAPARGFNLGSQEAELLDSFSNQQTNRAPLLKQRVVVTASIWDKTWQSKGRALPHHEGVHIIVVRWLLW